MPFTPFHMGPGILFKGILRNRFSILIFGWTQIVMDIQPLIAMLTDTGQVHGFTHTYIGSLFVAFVAGYTGKYLFEYFRKLLNFKFLTIMTFRISIYSAFIGTLSHVFLDSIMHSDVEPFYPFSESNMFYKIVSITVLHNVCLLSGIIGSILYFAITIYKRKNR